MKVNVLFGRGDLSSGSHELEAVVEAVTKGQDYLRGLSIDDLIGFFDALGRSWAEKKSPLQEKYGAMGLNFLLYFFRESHLKESLDVSLRGNRGVLDQFCSVAYSPRKLSAQPRGLICHWLAGNVPLLGMLSLTQGVLTKNSNIIKVSKKHLQVIPDLLGSFAEMTYTSPAGKIIRGKDISSSIAAIHFESSERSTQEALSFQANVRVAWGGLEAVESIMNLPKRFGCEDVIFGPKTSFVVVGREFLSTAANAQAVAKKVAIDATFFDQQGCNSPHTIFVEQGASIYPNKWKNWHGPHADSSTCLGITPSHFARLLAKEMEVATAKKPLNIAPGDTLKIAHLRTEYDMRGEAHYSDNLDWTVLFSEEDKGLATPCFYRTLFVRPVEDAFEVEKYCSHLTQSAGTALSPERKELFARRVTAKGIDRCPDVGSMTLYEFPWDGIFTMDRFVRWCKL